MTEQSDHTHINPQHLAGPAVIVSGLYGTRFALFFLDYLFMKFDWGQRGHQLHTDHLVCRFCGNPIDLIGAWKCACGFKRPGNYYGRCPKCLKHPIYIDCPVCGFTMDVR